MYNSQIHNRQNIRIKGYDYSQPGRYFITLNVRNSADLLGEISNGKMILNQTGMIAEKCWLAIPEHYPDAILHEYVIMPDHLHGIIELKRKSDKEIISMNSINVVVQNFEPRQKNKKTEQNDQNQSSEKNGVTNQQLLQQRRKNEYQKIIPRSIGCIIRGYKTGVTKLLNESIWQRNYYEHIIRSEASYKRIAQYIINNPANWKDSKF